MQNYWRERLASKYIPTESKIGLDELLQEAEDAYLGWLGASLTAFHGHMDDSELDKLDGIFQGSDTVRYATKDCYDYAINGHFRLARGAQELELMNDWLTMLAILVISSTPGIEIFTPTVRGRAVGAPLKVAHILNHALVRARLDQATCPNFDEDTVPEFLIGNNDAGHLTLKEIALLGRMSERAVRNAAQPTAGDQLKTRKEKHNTVVDADEALRWLKGRRGFIATRVE